MFKEKTGRPGEEFEAFLNWDLTTRCNLSCEYCDYSHSGPIFEIKIPPLIKTLDRSNKVFCICFSGTGETFLIPNIVEACAELAKKHYIYIFTNLTSTRIVDFANAVSPERVLFIMASLHIRELERLNLLDRYINNFNLLKKKGFDVRAREVAHPSLANKVNEYKRFFKERGIDLIFKPLKPGIYDGKQYPDSYTEKEWKIFGMDKSYFAKLLEKSRLCNAGYNIAEVDSHGKIFSCPKLGKPIGNIYEEVKFTNQLTVCPFEKCDCPTRAFSIYLFDKAFRENKKQVKEFFKT